LGCSCTTHLPISNPSIWANTRLSFTKRIRQTFNLHTDTRLNLTAKAARHFPTFPVATKKREIKAGENMVESRDRGFRGAGCLVLKLCALFGVLASLPSKIHTADDYEITLCVTCWESRSFYHLPSSEPPAMSWL